MTLMWDTRYELGHDRIDAEHRIFLGLIVDFGQLASSGAPREKLSRTLAEISKYGAFHFLSEENVMLDCHYPDVVHHAQLHRDLLAEVDDRLHRFITEPLPAEQVFEFLFEWFALHTTSEDKKLVAYLRAA